MALLALLLDLALGEPAASWHPTVWMGRWIASRRARIKRSTPLEEFAAGAGIVVAGAVGTAAAAAAVARLVQRLPRRSQSWAAAAALKPALALRALLHAGARVERELAAGRLGTARRLLGYHLVSRKTATLAPAEVAGATIESLAENLSDGFVAPLLAYRVGGLPAAYVYRFVNTADAMLGYRTEELEWLGKCAARSDDWLNLVPARLTALLIALAAPAGGGNGRAALRAAFRDARRTTSPNAGWPMAAMAGALGCRLSKRDGYVLCSELPDPQVRDIARARRIIGAAAALATVGLT